MTLNVQQMSGSCKNSSEVCNQVQQSLKPAFNLMTIRCLRVFVTDVAITGVKIKITLLNLVAEIVFVLQGGWCQVKAKWLKGLHPTTT